MLYRLVESQEQVATLGYVDTLEEQALLEALLENSKPDYPEPPQKELHYLLKTPFRYPPLRWGSRFGRVHEPSLFYGGQSPEAALVESAYYRFLFLYSMAGDPPAARLNTQHSLFSVGYRAERGVQLQLPPFNEFMDQLTDPQDYRHSQALGSAMRAAGVEAFEYCSARSSQRLLCGALYTPRALAERTPQTLESWFCELTQTRVTFKARASGAICHFPLSDFLVDGQLPSPA